MARRLGTVLVFREDATKEEIDEAFKPLVDSGLIDCSQFGQYPMKDGGIDYSHWDAVPYHVEEFDEEIGGPVWYVP